MDRLSTEQFGAVARQVADESQNDNSAAPCALSLLNLTGTRENAKSANAAHDISLIRDLENRRHTLGLSVGEVGDRCGIDENFLSEWECGIGSPRLDAFQSWAAALGLTTALVPAESAARHGLLVDWDKRRIALDGTPIRLTPMEWKALERLAWIPGELVNHQALFRHLYGDDRHHRAQSTAVRVLITKLRRLLPVRIEARWGQGYVISGVEPSLPAHRADAGVRNAGAAPPPKAVEKSCDRVAPMPMPMPMPAAMPMAMPMAMPGLMPGPGAMPMPAPRNPTPIQRELASLSQSGIRRVAAAPARPSPCRAEELGVIERFLAERGATRCPDLTTIQQSPLPTLVWDKVKRKWVRPSATGCAAR